MISRFKSDILEDVQKSASGFYDSGLISKEEMERFDRGCLSPEITGCNNVFEMVENMDQDSIQFLAKRIKANVAFTSVLLNRKIIFDSIPRGFLVMLAEVFGDPLDHMIEFLSPADKVHKGKNRCSTKASNSDQMLSYEDAVRTMDLSKSQQRKLLSFLSEKRPNSNYSGGGIRILYFSPKSISNLAS